MNTMNLCGFRNRVAYKSITSSLLQLQYESIKLQNPTVVYCTFKLLNTVKAIELYILNLFQSVLTNHFQFCLFNNLQN
jgi:hypothetical protein